MIQLHKAIPVVPWSSTRLVVKERFLSQNNEPCKTQRLETPSQPCPLYIRGQLVEQVQSLKYLGSLVDTSGSVVLHRCDGAKSPSSRLLPASSSIVFSTLTVSPNSAATSSNTLAASSMSCLIQHTVTPSSTNSSSVISKLNGFLVLFPRTSHHVYKNLAPRALQ